MPEPDALAVQGECFMAEQSPLISIRLGSASLLTLNVDLDLVCYQVSFCAIPAHMSNLFVII